MTDHPGPGDGQQRRRRAPRLGDSRAPVATGAVLTAATVAVIAAFLILRSVTNSTGGSGDGVSDAATTVTATVAPATSVSPSTSSTTTTSTTSTTSTTAPTASKSDAIVVVANASGVGGSATAMTAALAADGYTTAPVANSTGPRIERSIIYYVESDPAALGVAQLLAKQIPTAQVLPMPDPPPLDRPLGRATVALLLGTDAAGRPLAGLRSG